MDPDVILEEEEENSSARVKHSKINGTDSNDTKNSAQKDMGPKTKATNGEEVITPPVSGKEMQYFP